MDVCQFHTRIYGKLDQTLFVFEPTWDSFRPITKVGWDGKKFSTDEPFKSNLFSPYYGFESPEQKVLCRQLAETTELDAREIKEPVEFWKWAGLTSASWFRDRPCVFLNECVPRNWHEYVKYLGSRGKTLRRRIPSGRVTRRLIRKS
jgi:hypothetical protein